MPELPEVETVKRGLSDEILGAKIERADLYRPNLRFPFPHKMPDLLRGKIIERVERRAKFLLFHFSGDYSLVGHLGMTGSFVVHANQDFTLQKHDHMVWNLSDGRAVIYNDPRRFGFVLALVDAQKMLDNLGVEPFSEEFNADFLRTKMQRSTAPIKVFLLNQKIIVGIGNIYASEILFRCGINPQKATNICLDKADLLVEQTRQVLSEAIESGGSTLRNYANASGESGYFQHHFRVYDKGGQNCEICANEITRIVQAGRASFFCEKCQS